MPTSPRPRSAGRVRRVLAVALALAAGVGAAAPASAAPSGGSASYRLSTAHNPVLGVSEVIRWNPCSVIDYRVNARLAGRQGLADAQAAVRRLSAASGLRFRYLGSTNHVPARGRAPLPGVPLVIAWAPAGSAATGSDLLGPGEIGRGGWSASTSPSGRFRIRSGYVVVRAGAPLAQGFGPGVSRGRVLLHELGHAVGLGHVRDGAMVMNTTVSASSPAAEFGAGDRAGLRRVGAPAGCIA